MLSVIRRTLERERGYLLLEVCEADGWWRLSVDRAKDQFVLRFVEARSGDGNRPTRYGLTGFTSQPPEQAGTFEPVYGAKMEALTARQRKRGAEEVHFEYNYVTWTKAPNYAERWMTITWIKERSASGPWMQMLEEMLPPGPVRLRLQTTIWR